MHVPSWLWAGFTVTAAGVQTVRNVTQRDLIATVGTVGATHVRFLFGLPFAILFLGLLRLATGVELPAIGATSLLWIAFGALTQVAATGLMLTTMRARSFMVTIAYTKAEPVQIALFGIAFLGDRVNVTLAAAIVTATAGVMLMSWPKSGGLAWRPALFGIVAGTFFALAAIGFRGGVTTLATPSFVIAASTTLVVSLAIQTVLLSAYLIVFEPIVLPVIFRAWRPSLVAGFTGALASQFWFLAFAIQTSARVRTLGLVEMIFAQVVSRRVLREGASLREWLGMGLIVAGVALLLNS